MRPSFRDCKNIPNWLQIYEGRGALIFFQLCFVYSFFKKNLNLIYPIVHHMLVFILFPPLLMYLFLEHQLIININNFLCLIYPICSVFAHQMFFFSIRYYYTEIKYIYNLEWIKLPPLPFGFGSPHPHSRSLLRMELMFVHPKVRSFTVASRMMCP